MIYLNPNQVTEAPIFNYIAHVLSNGAHVMATMPERGATIGAMMQQSPRRLVNLTLSSDDGIAGGHAIMEQIVIRVVRAMPNESQPRILDDIHPVDFMATSFAARISIPLDVDVFDGFTYLVLLLPKAPATIGVTARFTFNDGFVIDTTGMTTHTSIARAAQAIEQFVAPFNLDDVGEGERVLLLRRLGEALAPLFAAGRLPADVADAVDVLRAAGSR